MKPHSHLCMKCRRLKPCKRKGMDIYAESVCASKSNHTSICDRCMRKFFGPKSVGPKEPLTTK